MTRNGGADGGDEGAALLVVLLAMLLLSALGTGLLMVAGTERTIASQQRAAIETFYAADAALEHAIAELAEISQWNDVIDGSVRSRFVEGSTTPILPGNRPASLIEMTAELQARSDARAPGGPDDPRVRLFAYGPLDRLPGADRLGSPAYVAVWVSDDTTETDGNPVADSNRVLAVTARAFGHLGAASGVEAVIERREDLEGGHRAQRGLAESNARRREAPVQRPGRALQAMQLNVLTGGIEVR